MTRTGVVKQPGRSSIVQDVNSAVPVLDKLRRDKTVPESQQYWIRIASRMGPVIDLLKQHYKPPPIKKLEK